jgi:hypothetical protein
MNAVAQEDDGSQEEMENEGSVDIDGVDVAFWSMPTLSHAPAAGLQELHLINANHNYHDVSIQAVSSCVNLQKLNVEDTYISSDLGLTPLGALAALTQLREVTLKVGALRDLAPLKSCAQLTKLDSLRRHRPDAAAGLCSAYRPRHQLQ